MYFIRYTQNPEADLKRKYSFAGYMLFDTEDEALAEFSLYGDEEYVAQDNVTGMWGRRLSGLCGFGPFETIEEAQAAINDTAYSNYRGESTPGTIYKGVECFDPEIDGSDDEGVRFIPSEIVKRSLK